MIQGTSSFVLVSVRYMEATSYRLGDLSYLTASTRELLRWK